MSKIKAAVVNTNVQIYACGGSGINVGKYQARRLIEPATQHEAGFSNIDIAYLDTSIANIRNMSSEGFYHFTGTEDEGKTDGGGKIRARNIKIIQPRIKDALLKFPPKALNVIIAGTSGASGSTIGPLLAKELLARGVPTVIIAIAGENDARELKNNIDTVLSYDRFAIEANAPLAACLIENRHYDRISEIDEVVHELIVGLCCLYSGQNDYLDTADLDSWLNYTSHTQHPAGLAKLEMLFPSTTKEPEGVVVSVATLIKDRDESSKYPFPSLVDFHTHGVMPADIHRYMQEMSPIHFALYTEAFHATIKHWQDSKDRATEITAVRPIRKALSSNAAGSEGDLVL